MSLQINKISKENIEIKKVNGPFKHIDMANRDNTSKGPSLSINYLDIVITSIKT